MRTIEEEAERVRLVHEKLGEPPRFVWVAKWQNRYGEGLILFRTEAGARKQLLEWLRDEQDGMGWSTEDFAATYGAIESGELDAFDDEGDRWYSIYTEDVNP